jgi:hypothetical protein
MTTLTSMKQFHKYVHTFYGIEGVYDMGATGAQIAEATHTYLVGLASGQMPGATWGDGDSIDRERVRDILIERFGLRFPS